MLIVHGSCLIVDPIDPDNERNYRLLPAACVDTEMYSRKPFYRNLVIIET